MRTRENLLQRYELRQAVFIFSVDKDFEKQGAEFIHIVDLEGAKDGTTPNIDVVEKIIKDYLPH